MGAFLAHILNVLINGKYNKEHIMDTSMQAPVEQKRKHFCLSSLSFEVTFQHRGGIRCRLFVCLFVHFVH